ncbi:hypothetical protein QJS04_geneDACA023928 [Acorus gramineus]|uniref:Acyl-ACP thioesterase-like C-terminal domain-containing protein n=1 Tax=Acorus gramineus TaxID=55184 RepID=A0AAV9BCA9_ACOGR|nr:hypothetical protein QJS04_geneDACA023928 [Acorus gramineus]
MIVSCFLFSIQRLFINYAMSFYHITYLCMFLTSSKWVMMNQITRRLQRVSDDVRDEVFDFCPKTPRLAFPEENSSSSKKIPKLEEPAQYTQLGLVPRRADLDMNQHVNNVAYIGWVLEEQGGEDGRRFKVEEEATYGGEEWAEERRIGKKLKPSHLFDFRQIVPKSYDFKKLRESVPQEIIDTHELQTITLDYRRECQHNDVVDSLTSPENPDEEEAVPQLKHTNGSPAPNRQAQNNESAQFLHFLRLSSSALEINRGRTVWRKLLKNFGLRKTLVLLSLGSWVLGRGKTPWRVIKILKDINQKLDRPHD